jgi:urease accessory protein
MEPSGAEPTVLGGVISGLLHPVLGADHLLFLLALSLVGLRHRAGWMLGLLVVGLLGSFAGLVLPGLAGAEVMAALSLAVVALVLLDRLPRGLLLPAFALHGYVLSASVLGWTAMPVAGYLLGLVVSQGLLLLVSLQLLARACSGIGQRLRRTLALALASAGAVLALAPLMA